MVTLTVLYWLFVFGLVGVCICGIIAMVHSYSRKNRIQVWLGSICLGAIALYTLFVTELLPGASLYYDYQYTFDKTGRSMGIEELYVYESYREPLLGDGYSLYLYKFDNESARYFENPNNDFFKAHPFSSERSGWVSQNWKTSPLDSSEIEYRQFALSEYDYVKQGPMNKLDSVQLALGLQLNKEGNYYAYSAHHPNGGSVWNISFYILSPEKGWLVAIYNDM